MDVRRTVAVVALLAALAPQWAQAEQEVSHPYIGVTLIARTETSPRPLRMHIVDVSLAAPGIRLRLTPHRGPRDTIKQTTLGFLIEQKAQIAINAHFFEPWPAPQPDPGTADLVGIAASDGEVYSPFEAAPPKPQALHANAPGLNISEDNRASMVHRNLSDPTGRSVAEGVRLYNTLAGSEQIVVAGAVMAADSTWNNQLAPRTAIGLTAGQHLILFTVDGRQTGVSEGMKVGEVAGMLLKDYGVRDAIALDGGGSTTLAMADPQPHVVNVSVGIDNVPGTQRPVGSSLAIFAMKIQPTTTASSPASAPSQQCGNGVWWIAGASAFGAAAVVVVFVWRRTRQRTAG